MGSNAILQWFGRRAQQRSGVVHCLTGLRFVA